MGQGVTQHDEAAPSQAPGLLRDLWETKVWRLFPLLATYVISLTLLMPIKPNLMTNFFASRHSSHYVRCEDYMPSHEPKVCQDAHSSVVNYSSLSDFVSNSFLLFCLAPLVGKFSDAYGRRPFLAATFICASFPVMVLCFHLNFGLSMYFYFPAQAINGALSSVSICMAYVADVLHPEHRASSFGIILCCYSIGILVGPLGGGYIPPKTASVVSLGGLLFCVFYIILLIPESTSKENRLAARKKQEAEPRMQQGPWQGLVILGRSSLFIKLTVSTMICGVVTEAMYELLMQYFQIKLNFGTKDQSHMFVLAGLCGMFTQLVILRLLLRYVGKARMLLVGLAALLTQQILMVLVWNKPIALFAMCIGSIGNLTFPAISSIMSLNVPQSEQGAVQGALQGARALAQGIGPPIFAGLFALTTASWSPLPYFPGACFAFGALLILVALVVAATVDRDQAELGLHHDASDDDLTDPLLPDEEEGLHQEPCLGLAPYYTMQHDGVAMLMDQIPEIAVEALPKLVESTMPRAPSVSSCSSDEEAPVASSSFSHSGSRTPHDQCFPPRDSASSQHGVWGNLKATDKRGSERGDSD